MAHVSCAPMRPSHAPALRRVIKSSLMWCVVSRLVYGKGWGRIARGLQAWVGYSCAGIALLGALSQVACAPASSTRAPASESGAPADLKAQFEREAEPVQKHPVRGAKGFGAYIEAAAAPKVEQDGTMTTVTADLGWESNVQCFVYSDVIDAGAASHLVLESAAKSVTFRELSTYYFDHAGLAAMFALRGVYQVEQRGETMAGDFKLMVVSRPEYPLLCTHDAPGYAKSFARVVAEFAKSFEFASQEPKPARAELWRMTLDGLPVGFSRNMAYRMEDGKLRLVSLSAQFLPTAPGEMSFEDVAEVTTADGEGRLIAAKFLSNENGESSLSMDIEQGKHGYDYVGTIQGKEVKGSIKSKRPLSVGYAVEKKLRGLASKPKKTSFEQWEYHPSVDPSLGSKVSYDVTPEDGAMRVVATMGKRSITMRADERGVLKQFLTQVGPRQIHVDLVEQAGEL